MDIDRSQHNPCISGNTRATSQAIADGYLAISQVLAFDLVRILQPAFVQNFALTTCTAPCARLLQG
jgi:hypothetical protein